MLALLRLDLFSLSCGVKNTLRFVFSQTNVGFPPLAPAEVIDILRVAGADARAHPGPFHCERQHYTRTR